MASPWARNSAPPILDAIYKPATLPEHRGNPLIEALPPFQEAKEYFAEFARRPHFSDGDWTLPIADRMLAVMRLGSYLEPLPSHFEVVDAFGTIIRAGYAPRRPHDHAYRKSQNTFYRESMEGHLCPIGETGQSTAPGFGLFGISGSGKTTVAERALSFLPHLLRHPERPELGFIQVVYLKVDCPKDGSLKQLLLTIIAKLDYLLGTAYVAEAGRGRTADELILFVAKKLADHYVGTLVIDEIQNLLAARGATQQEMINFMVSLSNEVKVPVVVIGTPRAFDALKGALREARRVGDHGAIIWDAFQNDREWKYFLDALWTYQWTGKPVQLTKQLSTCIFNLTQGIPALAVRLFQLAQIRAMADRSEKLTAKLFGEVAASKFRLVKPMLDAIRSGNEEEIKRYEDLFTKGLDTVGKAVDREAKLEKLRQASLVRNKASIESQRAVSGLIAMGHEATDVQKLVDELYARDPDISANKAVLWVLNLVVKNRDSRDPDGPSIREIVSNAVNDGLEPIDALSAAGLSEPLTEGA